MSDSENSTATSVPKKTFICPNCKKDFISGKALGGHKKAHRKKIAGDRAHGSNDAPTPGDNGKNPDAAPPPSSPVHAPKLEPSVPEGHGLPHHLHPYARPNDNEANNLGGNGPPQAKTCDFLGKHWTLILNVQAEVPAETAKYSERMVTNPIAKAREINASVDVNSKKKAALDLELKMYWS